MRALIFDNKVVDIQEADFDVHESFTWMDLPEDGGPGWILKDGVLVAPPEEVDPRTYAELRLSGYPYLGDQLDDLFHKGAFSDEMTAILQAVKDKYPKPE